jgi:peptidoglycan-N-acetylglucosamine deacetylase
VEGGVVVSELNRRRFLGTLAATVVAGVGIARATVGARSIAQAVPAPPPPGPEPLLAPPVPGGRVRLPGGGALTVLPGDGDLLALTVDDGVNSEVVRLYTQFAKDTGVRLTYFVNGTYGSWTEQRALLAPLVESGQIQLGNHTWSHPDLTTVSQRTITEQITRNAAFLKNTYGVDAAPYLRPPYGNHNATVDAVATDLGYTAITLWSGSLSDSTVVTPQYIVAMAKQYFRPQAIVIGHLNHPPVTGVYPDLVAVIRERNLRTVTLDDVFVKPSHQSTP